MSASSESNTPRTGFPPSAGTLDRALVIVRYLREHCAWDRRQTARSLVPHLLEEAHETVDAIHADDPAALRGELGDLLLNLAFQVVVAEEGGHFAGEDVVRELEEKMVRRHPHVFGEGERTSWEAIKAAERRERTDPEHRREEGTLARLASGLGPLLRAHRIQERVAGVGFDWDDARGALAKVHEELAEVEEAMDRGSESELTEEIGDLLFSVVNLARLAGVHPVPALEAANDKFRGRFNALEGLARERGVPLPGASLEELDRLWDEIKARDRGE